MSAVGFASIPISISARGVMADLEKQIGQPMHKVAQKAATDMERAIVDGAKRTANEVEKARKAEVRAAADVEKAEQKIMAAKEKTRQQTAKVETAEKQLELVRSQQSRKVEDMEASLEKARKDGKLTAEELKRSEELLREARLKADIAVEAKEQAVQRAYEQSARAAQAVEDAEKDRQKALSKAKDAADNVIAAQKRMDDAQGDTNREVREGTSAFEKLREQLRLTGSDLDEAAGKSAGFGDKLLGGLKTMGTGALLGVGAKIGTTITSGIGTAFSKGFSRLESLEQAEASLRGLGRSAEDIELIMGSVNQAVTGTAYGLDEASKAAATFSTLGVASGEGMDRVMSLLVDTTAQANSSLDEMSPIMGKIVAAGGLTTETFDQLNERATGVGEALSKHLGVPIEEVRELAKTVDFETFAAAMEANIGGAAQESGATFGNAFGNMQAALGRLGQKFLEPAFNMGPAVFGSIGGAVDKVNEKITPLVEEWSARLEPVMQRFADRLGPALEQSVEDVADALAATVGWVKENEAWLKPLAAVVGGAAAAFVAWKAAAGGLNAVLRIATAVQTAFNTVMLANPITLTVVALGALVAGLTYFFTQTETGQRLWATFTEKIGSGIDWVQEKFAGFKQAITWVKETIVGLWDLLTTGDADTSGIMAIFGPEKHDQIVGFIDGVRGAFQKAGAAITAVFDWIVDAGKLAATVFATIVITPLVVAWNLLSAAAKAAWEGTIKPIFEAFSAAATWLWDTVLEPTFTLIGEKFSAMADGISAAWSWVGEQLAAGWAWISDNVLAPLGAGIEWLAGWFDYQVNRIRAYWYIFQELLHAGWVWVDSNVFQPINTGIEWVAAWFDHQINRIRAHWQVFQELLHAGWVWVNDNVFAAIGRGLDTVQGWFQVGVDAMGQIWSGLKAKFAEPIDWTIRVVYTDGIKKVFDGVAEKVGLDSRLPTIKPIGGYARGVARVPGAASLTDNVHMISTDGRFSLSLRGRESVLVPEVADALGERTIDDLNRIGLREGARGVSRYVEHMGGFATGGVLPNLGAFARGGYIHAPNAGALSKITETHAKFIARFFPGIFTLTSALRFTDKGHHSTGNATDWSNGGNAGTPQMKALANAIFTNFPNSAELIHWPLAGWQNLKDGTPLNYGEPTNSQHRDHVHWATRSPLQFNGDDIVLDDVPGSGFSFNPVSWLTGLWDRVVGALPTFDKQGFGDLAKVPGALLSTAGGWVKDWATSQLKAWGSKLFSFGGGGDVESYRGLVESILREKGLPLAWTDSTLRRMNQESTGNPRAINEWDSNYLAGTPSKGLMQVIDPTFAAHKDPGYDDIWDPEANIRASMNYAMRRYGSLPAAYDREGGYARGGVINLADLRVFDQGGWLMPGGMAVNRSPSPEPVFNAAQWQDIRGLINAIGDLHPELRRMVDELTPQIESMVVQLGKVADPTSEQGIAARSIAGRVLDMGILPQGEVIQSLLTAESDLLAARAAHAERLQGITDKEKELAEAQKDLEELLSSDGEMSVANQRKLADAEKALANAKADAAEASGEKQAAAAEKVADAEEKLRRVREDVAADADKDAAKRDDEIAKATERVTKAENDLASARQESVKALDMPIHSLLPQLSGGLMSLSTMAGAASPALAGVAAQLAGAAAMAGPAGISVGVALTAIESALSVARKIWDVLDKLVSWVNRIRVEHARLVSESMSSILEWTRLVDQQRQVVGELQQQLINDQIALMGATWRVRQAQFDQARAQLDGVRNVAAAQAALDAEREAAAKRAMWDAKHLGTAFDRYRWAQKLGWAELLQDATIVTPEILALQHEVNAAKLTAELTQRQAVLATLQATWEQHRASVALMRTQEKLRIQTEQLARMAGTEYGMTTGEATVAAEIARLAADTAQLQGAKNDLGSRARGFLGRLLDWDGDGKILGMIDMPWTQEQLGLDAAIAANQKQIERLMQMEAAGLSPEQLSDMERIIHEASLQYAAGRDAAGDAIIRGSWLGDAQRAKEITGIEQAVIDWEQSMLDLQNSIQDAQDTLAFETQAQELAELIAALQAAANSEQYRADAIREDNIAVREALEALADLESSVSREIVEKRPINITIAGDAMSSEQVRALLEQLNAEAEELDIRVTHLEEPGRDEALVALDSRRRW